jgi:methylenetetrahydrofolate dehydrogenase (NADP+)/methenyltetrahydrofolate cyclohydrolase
MKILDGKKLASDIQREIKTEILALKEKSLVPGLAVILIGHDSASEIYVRNKERACRELGIYSEVHRLEDNISENEILNLIKKLNSDQKIHGLLVQLPLPKNLNEQKIIEAIDPRKDVDCFHPENIGKLFLNNARFLPCTPAGILEIFKKYSIEVSGKDCVIVGASNIVGKPLAIMLANAGATVTNCNAETKNLKEKVLSADILVSAVGKINLITADMVKSGSVIMDVGMNRNSGGKIIGDVDFEAVKDIAGAITPVPGGVGPMTVAMLAKNTLIAFKIQNEKV